MLAYVGVNRDSSTRVWILEVKSYRWRGGLATGAHKAVYAPDANAIATVHADGTIRLWQFNAHAWREHSNLRADGKKLTCVAFSPDGTNLVAGGLDGTILKWRWTK